MRKLKHPNILKLLQNYQTNNNIYLITEYCNNGDLEKSLNGSYISEKASINIMK
jgi:serine/threonine-protein kinase ULK/ATG1